MMPVESLLLDHPITAPRGAKDARGTALVIAVSPTCPGAAVLASEAALRTGAGRVQIVVHPTVAATVAVAVPEAFVLGWSSETEPTDELLELVSTADAVVLGPGHTDDVSGSAIALADRFGGRALVLDAGALPAATELASQTTLVIAPNTDEATKILGMGGSEADLAHALGGRLRRPVAVRGPITAITDGRTVWHHASDAAGLGTPGSGDVLMGTLVALLARGMDATGALGWAVSLHGRAGEVVERSMPVGYLARDVLTALPTAFIEMGAT
jgi:hydroxyethylthiazole kinase-like uncharacterized protein yjeF